MSYNVRMPGLPGVRGTHYTAGSDFFYYLRNSGGADDGVYRIPIAQSIQLVESYGNATTPPPSGRFFNLDSIGNFDIRWVPGPPSGIRALGSAQITPIVGATSLEEITPDQLLAIDWGNVVPGQVVEDPGTSTTGNFYALRVQFSIERYHHIKLRVYNDGETRLDWVVYSIDPNPHQLAPMGGDWQDLVVSDYESSFFLSGVDQFGNSTILRVPQLQSGPYPVYGGFPEYLVYGGSGVNNPRQMVVDGDYVYFVDDTHLWRVNLLNLGLDQIVTLAAGQGVGLLLDTTPSGVVAYISNSLGDVYVCDLSEWDFVAPIGSGDPVYSIGGASGFMTWTSDEHTSLLVTDRDGGRVVRIDVADGSTVDEVTGLSTPWSVEVISSVETYVGSDGEIGVNRTEIEIAPGIIMLGIGLVPFDYINNSADEGLIFSVQSQIPVAENVGRADTSGAPGYYFSQYPNLPFGGSLSLQLNHEEAWTAGFRYYRVTLQNGSGGSRTVEDSYVNLRWDGMRFVPETIGGGDGLYPVLEPDDLWYNPYLALVIPTTVADNGHNVLRVEFFTGANAAPSLVESRLILLDNTRYNTSLQYPRQGTDAVPPVEGVYPTLDCGCISYTDKNNLLEVDFSAWHPQGVGSYRMRFFRGSTHLASLQQTGNVTNLASVLTQSTAAATPLRVGHLIDSCDVANVRIEVTVSSRVINGFGWVNLGSRSTRSFTFAPAPLSNTPWVDPG